MNVYHTILQYDAMEGIVDITCARVTEKVDELQKYHILPQLLFIS